MSPVLLLLLHKFYEQRKISETFANYEGPSISDFILGVEDVEAK